MNGILGIMNELIETKEDRLFLKLQIAKGHNKELLTEIGVLQSEKDELKYEISVLKDKIRKQAQAITNKEKVNKNGLYYRGVNETISVLISKVSNNIKLDMSEIEKVIENSFKKWSPLKSKNEIQQQEKLLKNNTK